MAIYIAEKEENCLFNATQNLEELLVKEVEHSKK